MRIDDQPTDISQSLKLNRGSHTITIQKTGYTAISDSFTVDEDHILFRYTLEKTKLAVIEVTTNPPGAQVTIEGVKLIGVTPLSDVFEGGRHPIHIEKDKYLPIDTEIFIDRKKEKNQFSYTLEPNFGTILITSQPEVNMTVSLNGLNVGKTPLELKECPAGEYAVSANHEYYTAASLKFTLKRGETYRATVIAEENLGILTIQSTPGATVYLNDNPLEKLTDLRLPPQTIRLRAEKPKCDTRETTLILRKGAVEIVDLTLAEKLGSIAVSVSPSDAHIELLGDAGERFTSDGTKVFSDIPIGTYRLKIEKAGYRTETKNLVLGEDKTLQEKIVLQVSAEQPEDRQISQKIIGSCDTPGYAWGVAFEGSCAFVADYESGLQVIDVSNPAAPHIIGSCDTPGYAEGVAVDGGCAFVADRYSGLQIIRYAHR